MNLTNPQKLIYDMEKYAGGSISVVCGSMLIKTGKSVEEMTRAVNEIYRINDALRIRVLEENGQPHQYIAEYMTQEIEILTFNSKEELDNYASKYAKEPLDFYGSLCDIKIVILPDRKGILAKLHHFVSDAWTLSLLGTQFNKILHGEEVEAYSFADYVNAEERCSESKRYAKDKDYFISQFRKFDEATYLSEKQSHSYDANRRTFIIEKYNTQRINKFTTEHGTSVFNLFMATLATYINRTKMNTEKFYIGTAVLNRIGIKEQNTMGMFINTAPVLIELSNESSFADNLESIQDSLFSVLRHQKYNYGTLLEELRKNYSFSEKLYDVILSYQNAKVLGGEIETTWYHSGMQTESLQIHIDDRDSENIFRIHYDYLIEKFSEHEIEKIHEHICNLLFDAVEHSGKKLYELDILTADEQQKLLYAFNDTAVDYPRDKCVHQLFEEQAEKTPDKVAVVFKNITLTYSELNLMIQNYADKFVTMGIKANDVVAIHLERSHKLIAFQLAVLKIGAVFLPVDKRYPKDRIEYMCSDCEVKLFISDELDKTSIKANIISLSEFESEQSTVTAQTVNNQNVCYIIYTSGSTGTPKGCMLTGQGLLNFCKNNNTLETLSKYNSNVFACVNSVSFDYFIAESLLPLTNGFTTVMLDDSESTVQEQFLDAVVKNKINVVMTTPTRLNIFFDDKCNCQPLQQLTCICTSGEPLTPELLTQMYEKSPNAQIYNPIGPSECSVWDIGGKLNRNNGIDIHIGKPIANTQIYIVDKYMQPAPIGVTGELCIAGDGVGAGYLNRPELTAEKFIDNPFGKGKLYKTGDLAYWREDGNIVYVGRNDFQVKIRGLRIELGEIENAISGINGISQAVVVVRKNTEGRQLICAFYTGTETDAKEIRSHIGKKLPKYMLPHIFSHLDEMPLTSSGKINRKALPEVDLYSAYNKAEYVAPQTEREKTLVAAVETVLGCEKISLLDNFFDLGGDSLKAIELISKLEMYGFDVQIKTVFSCETIKDLAEVLTVRKAERKKVEYGSVLPATPAQMRVYTAQSINLNSTLYNIPYIFKTENLDPERLEKAVNELIARHESLRTHFENRNGQIVQVIDEEAKTTVTKLENNDFTDFIKQFDLTKSPLVRAGYHGDTVIIDMHHIISDGGSMPVFFRELNELYMGRKIESKAVQYGEFACETEKNEESEKYWLSVYDDEPPVLEINTDFKRGQQQSFNGSAIYDTLDIELHNKILAFSKEQGITPYVVYMAGFNILLSKFSGNEDIVVGMPISGRDAEKLDTIGMFVNTIALRNKPVGTKTVTDFLQEVKENSIAAINHQDYPYGELVKKLNISTTDRNPLFDVMLAYQSEQMTDVVFGDKKAELLPIPATTAKYDVTFNVMPRENDVVIMAEYCTDLYKEKTIQRFVDGYKLILNQLLDGKTALKDITAVSEPEQQKLLYAFNDTAVDYPRDKCVHQLFEEQVEKTADKTAVIACDKTLTYQELNEEANRIAHSLIEKGVGVGDIVTFMLPRRSDLIATMLGILKSGAAYMPIDPDYPQDRIEYMLSDSGAKLCITDANISELLNNENENNPCVSMTGENLCYCIYTSGSTGMPKGTLLTHANVVNYVNNNNNNNVVHRIIKDSYKNIVSVTTVGFDIFVTESLLPLVNGMEILLANEEQAKFQSELNLLIKQNPADVIQTTPTKMKSLIADKQQLDYLETVKVIILGGEALETSLVEELGKITEAEIFNIYGPTETTVWSTNAEIKNELSVYDCFNNIAECKKKQIALCDKNKELTYQQLNDLVNNYCAKLQAFGIKKDDVVAIHLERSIELVVFQLAVLKAGAIFLPVDKRYPIDRIDFMCKDCSVALLISDEFDSLSNSKVLSLSAFKAIVTNISATTVKNNGVCYIIYTSGSTGNPKGCMLKGRA